MTVRSFAYLDTWELAASLRDRMNLFRELEGGERVLPVRWNSGEKWMRTQHWTKWGELRNAISRVQKHGEALVGHPIEAGSIRFEMIQPGHVTPWSSIQGVEYVCAHLPIRTNPACFLHFPAEMHYLLPGHAHVVGVQIPHSWANMGEWPRIHLVMEFRAEPEAESKEPEE